MFRWGIYSATITVLSFIVGLHWGVVGVAAAYALSGYLLRNPVLAVLIHRVGPVSALDFLLVQGLFVVSGLLAWLAYGALPEGLTGRNAILSIIVAIVVSYGIALTLALVLPQSRNALMRSARNILRSVW